MRESTLVTTLCDTNKFRAAELARVDDAPRQAEVDLQVQELPFGPEPLDGGADSRVTPS